MAVSDETMRSFERAADEFCRAFAAPAPTLSKTSEAPVVAVHDDGTVDVGYGGAVLTVRMTTACSGVAVGDTVLLTAYGQMLYATGILARDNGHSVNVRQVFTISVEFGSVAAGAFGKAHADIADHGCLSAPVVIPVSTGWVEAREANDVTAAGFTANCFNAGPGTHSGVARYTCIELA